MKGKIVHSIPLNTFFVIYYDISLQKYLMERKNTLQEAEIFLQEKEATPVTEKWWEKD